MVLYYLARGFTLLGIAEPCKTSQASQQRGLEHQSRWVPLGCPENLRHIAVEFRGHSAQIQIILRKLAEICRGQHFGGISSILL